MEDKDKKAELAELKAKQERGEELSQEEKETLEKAEADETASEK